MADPIVFYPEYHGKIRWETPGYYAFKRLEFIKYQSKFAHNLINIIYSYLELEFIIQRIVEGGKILWFDDDAVDDELMKLCDRYAKLVAFS